MRSFILAISILLSSCSNVATPPKSSTTGLTQNSSDIGLSLTNMSFNVTQFSPAASRLASPPSSVQIHLSQSSLNLNPNSNSSVVLASNYTWNCAGINYSVSSVTYNYAAVITVSLPSVSVANGSTCTLSLASAMQDSFGNYLTGPLSVSYYIL